MSSHAPSRAASIAERRASAAVRQKSRPASVAIDSPGDHSKTESKTSLHNRKPSTTTSTSESRRDTWTRESLVKRTTVNTLRRNDGSVNGRRSTEVERPRSGDKTPVRMDVDDGAGMSLVRAAL